MPTEAGKIRNVAVTGHRGTGKTSLVESMLFQAGAINRLAVPTLYGDLFVLDAATGANLYGSNPVFRASQDKKPIGGAPGVRLRLEQHERLERQILRPHLRPAGERMIRRHHEQQLLANVHDHSEYRKTRRASDEAEHHHDKDDRGEIA